MSTIRNIIPSHVLEHHVASRLTVPELRDMDIAGFEGFQSIATGRVQTARKREKTRGTSRGKSGHEDRRRHQSRSCSSGRSSPHHDGGGTLTFDTYGHQYHPPHGFITHVDVSATFRSSSRAVGIHRIIISVRVDDSVMTVDRRPMDEHSKLAILLATAALRHAATLLNLRFDIKRNVRGFLA